MKHTEENRMVLPTRLSAWVISFFQADSGLLVKRTNKNKTPKVAVIPAISLGNDCVWLESCQN